MTKNLLLTLGLLASSMLTFAQNPFNPGNVVVVRIGNGTGDVANLAPVSLLEYTPQGALVQTVALNSTTAGSRLTLNLNNAQEGGLNLSTNNDYLSLIEYDGDLASGIVVSATGFDKVIARITSGATIDYSTKIPKADVTNIRQTTSIDGSGFWYASSQNGVKYVPFANPISTSSTSIITTPTNIKGLNIFNGQLYGGGFNNSFGISKIGTGLPTSAATFSSALPGLPTGSTGNANGFYFFDLDNNNIPDVVYTIDGINLRKYSFSAANINYVSTITNPPGTGTYGTYATAPTLTITGGGGTGATATVIFNTSTSKVTSYYISNTGTGYTSVPTVTVNGTPTGTAIAAPTVTINSAPAWVLNSTTGISAVGPITVSAGGTGYSPTISITGDGTGATATASVINGVITALNITNGGSGYTVPPVISFTSTTGSLATATATISGGVVTGATIINGGSGYGAVVNITGGTGATAYATSIAGIVTAITLTNAGGGFSSAPTVSITGEGSGATATAVTTTAFGITGIVNAGKVELFITTGSGVNNASLIRVTDVAGYNAAASLTFSNLASSGTNNVFRGVAFTPGTTTLPVDLTSFTGKNTTNGIQLNWETASEKNNDRFDVLRSNDANNFQIITSVKGKGTSNSLNKYNYLDAQPLSGTNYYKLNQVDFDGKNTPSNVIAIKTGLTESTITAYATSKELSFTVNALKAGIVRAQIFDVAGRKILDKTINLTVGVNINTLNIADLQQGVYIAKISTDGGKTLSQKFVKE